MPLIAEHLRDGRLVAPFPKRYDSARGYYAVIAPHAAERAAAAAFVEWLRDEAEAEATLSTAVATTKNKARRSPGRGRSEGARS